jgi:glycosyltransferase involved in cell wall biosynthesis
MRIASIVLSWNRAELLQKTLESYLATVADPFELTVIDNASSEGSREVIERFRSEFKSLKAIFLNQNLGGEAINVALEQVNGDLIHITENDQLFLDGWSQHVRESFIAFTRLGQLCLHGVVPTDDEVWELKSAHLRFSKGKIIYEAHGNIGTSSLIPAHVFRAAGVRLHNIAHNGTSSFKLPDDARLSADIKNLNLWCAWSDRKRRIGRLVTSHHRRGLEFSSAKRARVRAV